MMNYPTLVCISIYYAASFSLREFKFVSKFKSAPGGQSLGGAFYFLFFSVLNGQMKETMTCFLFVASKTTTTDQGFVVVVVECVKGMWGERKTAFSSLFI